MVNCVSVGLVMDSAYIIIYIYIYNYIYMPICQSHIPFGWFFVILGQADMCLMAEGESVIPWQGASFMLLYRILV